MGLASVQLDAGALLSGFSSALCSGMGIFSIAGEMAASNHRHPWAWQHGKEILYSGRRVSGRPDWLSWSHRLIPNKSSWQVGLARPILQLYPWGRGEGCQPERKFAEEKEVDRKDRNSEQLSLHKLHSPEIPFSTLAGQLDSSAKSEP